MRKGEVVKLAMVSSCHEVQGGMAHKSFEFLPDMVGDKISSTSTDEISQNNMESNGSLQSDLEEGELIEGIEANDVGALLEQFLEYEEKQVSLDCSSPLTMRSSPKDTSPEAKAIALKITSFVEAQDIDFELAVDAKNHGPSCLDVESSGNLPESDEVHAVMDHGSFKNGDRKSCVDNHATDHNYACSGFPMRKAGSNVNGPKSANSPKEVSASDLEPKSENSISNGAEMSQSRKRGLSACNKEPTDKERILPKRYRGPYCEDSSKGNNSSDEDHHYIRSRSRLHSSSDEQSDHERSQHNRTYYSHSGSSDTDKNQYKRSYRRHSLCSNDSFDERDCSSSDEDSRRERRCRYDPRGSESDLCHKRSSGSERESDSYRSRHRRRQRSCSKDGSTKTNDGKENKAYHDIELERKMGFKFDHNIKGTAKEERRIVYIGKISDKTTKDDVWRRFRPFGPIEKVTVHFREKGDNYAFVTFFDYSSAAEAIERGNDDLNLPVLDICFGGRRKFCGGSYVDFDSNTSYLEEQDYSHPPSSDEMDFDALLRLSQKSVKRRKESCEGR